MRLLSFSVTNFRSITAAHRIPIEDSTVLIGRNNEGKSNLLHALNMAMKALIAHAGSTILSNDRARGLDYSWIRDFPVSLQRRARGHDSIFRLEFSLTEEEIDEFRVRIGSNLNGTLPVEIKFGKNNISVLKVSKQGPGGATLKTKSESIAQYIAEKIDFIYIPAVRTEADVLAVVQEMLSKELAELEANPEYGEALQKIISLQEPILTKVADSIKTSLQEFLPGIKSVKVQVPSTAQKVALRSQCQIEIDDGSKTLLEYKGDGVKSLAALGLLKDKRRGIGASIVAIEEPESHLHPGAMHSLKEVLDSLTSNNQVVLTTHCPLFVDRGFVGRNILIDLNRAKPAKDIAAIRGLLGVRASDNLVNASHVLVVEGGEDVIAMSSLLAHFSSIISKAIKQHHLVIEQIGGAGNLSYKLISLANALCVTHVLLDHDDEGRKAFNRALNDKVLKVADVTFVSCQGFPDTEMEDIFSVDVYKEKIMEEFGVDLKVSAFRGSGKWSARMKSCFETQGKTWNDAMKVQVKAVTAEAVAKQPAIALHAAKRQTFDALIDALERKLIMMNVS